MPSAANGTLSKVSSSLGWEVNQRSTGCTANVAVTNCGAARSSWALTFTFPGDQRMTGAWSATVTQSGARVTARNASWNGNLPAGGTATVGFQATCSGANTAPADFALDGAPRTSG
ncbi:cellulose binding domain-containing protein [Micromonospora sp. CB01531]|uniref:cellulose binding domain-containing protein n=1 Tax=Micromonospora sp. CB01531 TaxID=1718947 RepID=UPI00093CEB37|nr:cellulose binding domain-containing protein [Micromonospora sp. CB01531]OKI46444.1 hypothetical protein A6A27_37210 [Micromonospora sp. CB01531]